MPSAVNLSRFDLVTLRLFVTAVDGGSLSAGARRFGISVAAASKRIADLETHVGMALLLRGKKGVVPTAAGQALLSLADFSGWLVKTDNLTEVEVVNVKVGQSVQVIFDALPETELSGEVTKIESRRRSSFLVPTYRST